MPWRETGVTSRIVIELGLNHGMNVYVLQNGRKISAHKHDRKSNMHASVPASMVIMPGFTPTRPCGATSSI